MSIFEISKPQIWDLEISIVKKGDNAMMNEIETAKPMAKVASAA